MHPDKVVREQTETLTDLPNIGKALGQNFLQLQAQTS